MKVHLLTLPPKSDISILKEGYMDVNILFNTAVVLLSNIVMNL